MSESELLERDAALARIRLLVADATGGEGRVVLVHGEPGAGKTALLRAAAGQLSSICEFLVGACDALATPRPLGPLRDLAPSLGEPLSTALTDGRPPYEVFAKVLECLRATPRVIVFEDVHWADEGTLDLLRYLGRRILTTPSLLVLTYRDVEVGAAHPLLGVTGDLVQAGVTERIALEPLSRGAVEAAVGDLPLDPDDVYAKTGGNPFFLAEVLAQPEKPVPENVRDAILGRTAGLLDSQRHALELVSCLPNGLPDEQAAALGVEAGAVDILVRRGLLVREPGRLRFRHEIGRLAILDSLAGAARRQLYEALHEVFAGSDDHALLTQLATGAGRAPDVVAHAQLAAAEAARAGAHLQAASFFEAALAYCRAEERADFLEGLSYERYHVDQIKGAIEAITEALQRREGSGQIARAAADRRWLSRLEWFCAHRQVAERHADAALEQAEQSGDRREIGFAQGQLATLAMTRAEPGPALDWGSKALAVAEEFDDDGLRAQMLTTIGMAELMTGNEAGIGRIRESATLAARVGMDEHAARALTNLSFFLVETRRLLEASDALEEGLQFTADRDLDTFHLYSTGTRARMRVHWGHWTAAWDDAVAVLRTNPAPLNAVWPLWVRGVLCVRRGDPDPVPLLEDAWRIASGSGEPYRLVPIAAALTEHEWLTGSEVGGADRLAELADRMVGTVGPWHAGEAATWLRRIGRAVPAGLDAADTPYAPQLDGDVATSLAGWRERLMPYDEALALIDADDSQSLLAALAICQDLGASTTAAWTRQRLRGHGIASPPRGPRPETRSNPAGLTARQVDVLHLVADGLTNAEIAQRLFISEKTAGHHVSAILTKFDVGSRRDAARIAVEFGVRTRAGSDAAARPR